MAQGRATTASVNIDFPPSIAPMSVRSQWSSSSFAVASRSHRTTRPSGPLLERDRTTTRPNLGLQFMLRSPFSFVSYRRHAKVVAGLNARIEQDGASKGASDNMADSLCVHRASCEVCRFSQRFAHIRQQSARDFGRVDEGA
jgi:hypothetical protein